jgi:hypothetical protein
MAAMDVDTDPVCERLMNKADNSSDRAAASKTLVHI